MANTIGKANMAVKLCGVQFKNPIIAASGTFGFGEQYDEFYDISELGGFSAKGLTPQPREGNPSPRIAETTGGMLNAVGLQNPGIDAFVSDIMPALAKYREKGSRIIANIAANTLEEYALMAKKLQKGGIDMIELNISCPNVKQGGVHFGVQPEAVEEVTRIVKEECDRPLIVKLTPNCADIAANAIAAQNGGADAISLINTITGMAVDIKTRKPILANVTGGLSGACVKPVALRMVYQAYKAVQIPIIGMGGIMSASDVVEFMLCGSSAVQIGTANIANPMACINILRDLERYLEENNIDDINSLVGGLKA